MPPAADEGADGSPNRSGLGSRSSAGAARLIERATDAGAAALSVTHAAEPTALDHITHNLRNPDGTPRPTLDFYEEADRLLEALFRRGRTEGSLRGLDARVTAVTYNAAIDMMLGYVRLHPDIDPGYCAGRLADILLGGIERWPPASRHRRGAACARHPAVPGLAVGEHRGETKPGARFLSVNDSTTW